MAVCFFDRNYSDKYRCSYEIKEGFIEVEVEYNIDNEIEEVNGIRIFSADTKFRKRDVLIIDQQNKKNYLIKDASFIGQCNVIGTPDNGCKTKFESYIFFEHSDPKKLGELLETPKVNRIKVFSKAINDLIGNPSLRIENSDSEYCICLNKQNCSQYVDINSNNIKRIMVSDNWKGLQSSKEHNIFIEFNGYIEIELTRRVNYDFVSDFINELELFIQLYYPDKFQVEEVSVKVGEEYYRLCIPQIEINRKEKAINKTVNVDLLEFLKKCYLTIPYRKSKAEFRNIPYIVMKTSRSVEDNFLMFYRFIECYYKRQQISGIRKKFVKYSIEQHYAIKKELEKEEIENYAQEIISLRNHYVHSGYYIKNSCLKVSFDKINGKKNPKDYTVKDVDVNWIYERTKMLYDIAIDIIFNNILGYSDYKFEKHF